MEPIENNNENLQDEVVTVEPGEEIKSVEEEIAEATPEEEKRDEEKSKPEEAEQQEEEVKKESSEEESKEEQVEESKESEEKPSDEEEKSEGEQEEKEEEENKPCSDDEGTDKDEEQSEEVLEDVGENAEESELDKVKAELEQMKEAEEVRKMEEARANAINQAVRTYDEFNQKLANAVEDTFKQYGIDPSISVEELQKDPAKYQIVQDIITNAQRIQAEKQAELMKPINDASNALVFREASKVMAQFDLTDEQTAICAETLINIFDATGLANLTDDLRAKVELAVARAKMIAPKVEKAVEQVKEIVEDVKEAVKDVAEEKAPEKDSEEKEEKEDVQKEEEQEPAKEEPVEEKPSLDAFKEGAAVGSVSMPGDSVDEDNVLEILASLPFKDRTRFLVKYADLVDRAGRKRRAQGK